MKRKRIRTVRRRHNAAVRRIRYEGREFGYDIDVEDPDPDARHELDWVDEEEVEPRFDLHRWESDVRQRSLVRQRLRDQDLRRGLYDLPRLRWRDQEEEYEVD